jgi:RimJ/RimL family protein N-acetyltransferase
MLAGSAVTLRAIERNDLEQLLAWRNRPDYRRYFREYRELSMDNQLRWFEGEVIGNPKVRMFSIVERSSGRLLGACGLCYIDWLRRSSDVSIYIGADDLYIDQHYAPDAASVMIEYGFKELGLHRLWAEIYDFDDRKKRLLEKLGFHLDGRFRDGHWTEGGWHDSLIYSRLSTDAPHQ